MMNDLTLYIHTLGAFSIRCGDRVISDNDDRSRRVWSLLAYMLCHRQRAFPQEELIGLYWSGGVGSTDPANALKSIFHRIRAALDKLQDGLGRTLICRKAGCYFWNNDIPLTVDADTFEALCQSGAAASDEAHRLDVYQQAIALYQGDLLNKLSGEDWLVPLAKHYHALYLEAAEAVAEALEKQGRTEECIALCREALCIEPYRESLYEHLMRGLLALGDHKSVVTVYEDMRELYLSHFGRLPSEPLRGLYHQATRTVNDHALTMDELLSQLHEEHVGGAMLCDYDFFRVLYRSEARSISRTGHAAHICLLSVTAKDGTPLSRRSLTPAMENLRHLLPAGLRKGDVVSQCSVSQFIILLPQANYDNSRMVSERLISAFYRRYPHSPARLRCLVQPLEPIS